MKIDGTTEIISVSLIDVDTGEESQLSEKENRNCHFKEPFMIGKYRIQLRIHWKDVDKNGEPMLDADIWTEENGKKKFLKKRKTPSHHTKKEFDETLGEKIYTFEFEDTSLRLRTKKSVAKTVTCDVILTVQMSATKNGEKII